MNKTLVYHSKTTKTMKQTIEIEVPEGYELKQTENGFEVVEVKKKKEDKSIEMTGRIDEESGIPCAWVTLEHAPDNLGMKCIVLHPDLNWEFSIHNGRHILIPTRK